MKKARWKDIALLNLTFLLLLGISIVYIVSYEITWLDDWHRHHFMIGPLIVVFSVYGYVLLILKSSIYLHSKTEDGS